MNWLRGILSAEEPVATMNPTAITDRVGFVNACLRAEYLGINKMLLLVDRDVLMDVNARLQTTLYETTTL